MDEKQTFLEVNKSDLRNSQIEELKKFHKTNFDLNNILSSANELKYTGELKSIISREFINPGPDFVKLFTRQVYDGAITAKILDQSTELVRKSMASYLSDTFQDKLNTVLATETKEQLQSADEKQQDQENPSDSGIVTTVEELEAYYTVKSILRSAIAPERVSYRDAQTYFTIIIDGNSRKRVCWLYLNSPTTRYITFDDEKKFDGKQNRIEEVRHKIESIDDIYKYSEQFLDAVKTLYKNLIIN